MKVQIVKGTAKNKKWKAIFTDADGKKVKTTQFGDNRYKDYTQHGDKDRRSRYRTRHKKDLQKGDYMSAGYLSYYILWAASTNINTNIRAYKRRFKLS